jgi:hypothetical protein
VAPLPYVLINDRICTKVLQTIIVWDKKRQAVWIAAGLILGTYISYSDSLNEDGELVVSFFVFMETLVLLIMGLLLFLYSRKS